MQRDNHGALTNLMLKMGLAKNAAQANIVMLIIAIVAAGLAIYLVLPNRVSTPTTPLIPGQIPGQGLPR